MRRLLLHLAFFLAVSCFAIAQTSTNPALASSSKPDKDQDAIGVLTRTAMATGWSPELRSIPVKVTGTISRVDPETGQPVPLDIVFKVWGPDKYRIETGAQDAITIVTPSGGYTKTKERDTYLPLHAAASIKPIFLPFLLENFDHRSANVEVKDAGLAEGIHKVSMRVTRVGEDHATRAVRRASPMTVWVSDDTGLPTQVEFVKVSINNENAIIHVLRKFSDYKPINGVMVPFHQEEWIGGAVSYTLDIKEVVFKAELDPSEFTAPKPSATAKGGVQ